MSCCTSAADVNQLNVLHDLVNDIRLESSDGDFLDLKDCNHGIAPVINMGRILSVTDHLRQVMPS